MKIDVSQESPKNRIVRNQFMNQWISQKNTIEGGALWGGEWNVGKVSTLGRRDARIHRNLGETSCEDTKLSPYSSSKCPSGD